MLESRMTALNLLEFQEAAESLLPRMYYDYIAGGAGDEVTLRANRQAFQDWRIVYRVLRGIERVDVDTTVLGQHIDLPVLLSPVAFQRLAHPDGEVASAAAAAAAGTIFTLSTLSTRTIEEVGAATSSWWFQLYYFADKSVSEDLLARAQAAGASAVLVTVDTPLLGRREADERNSFSLPEGVDLANLTQGAFSKVSTDGPGSKLAAYVQDLWHPSLSWDDVDWIRAHTSLPVGLKGVVAPEDARLAVEHGLDIVVVSNHGGRQLDQSIATLDALPLVAEAVDGRCEVLLDGGVRRGTDVIKALALGARAVMVGRPYIWGLAAAGQAGVKRVLDMLRAEIMLDMLLAGCDSPGSITSSLLRRA